MCVSATAQICADGVDSDRPTDQQSIWKILIVFFFNIIQRERKEIKNDVIASWRTRHNNKILPLLC